MAYSTADLVRKSLGDITEAELATIDIEEVIEETDSFINSYIAMKYAMPLVLPVPKMIQRLSRDIAACHLYEDVIASGISVEDAGKIKNRCDRAKETLINIRDGKQHLVNDDGTIVDPNLTSSSIAWNSNNGYSHPSFFDIDDDTDWAFNQDQLDAIGEERDA